MDGAMGSALEWALALLHAPGERHALRQKPLPEGVDRLLGIAAGAMPDALAEAARTFSEPESRIREAAQFYVREVLFFPQADAYRVLGVTADASAASIKSHHRLLQHWLHPDRLQSEDDAIFASRVNVAWNRLRNPERRAAYDKALQEEQVPEAFEGADAPVAVRTWIPKSEIPRSPWRHRMPMLVLSAACLLLVVLVLRDMEARQDVWNAASSSETGGVDAGGSAEISVPSPPRPTTPSIPVQRDAVPGRSLGDAVAGPAAVAVPAPAMPMPMASAMPAVPVIEPMPSTRQAVRVVEPPPRQIVSPDTPAARLEQPMVAAYTPPVGTIAKPSVVRDVPEPRNDGVPATPVAKTVPQQEVVLPSYQRIQQAWAAGDQLLRFMAAMGRPPPPIWSSPAIQSSADRLRQDMHGNGRVRLSGTQWQIGGQSAVLTSGYSVQGNTAGVGRLTADLVWREDRWLVVGLSIERAQ